MKSINSASEEALRALFEFQVGAVGWVSINSASEEALRLRKAIAERMGLDLFPLIQLPKKLCGGWDTLAYLPDIPVSINSASEEALRVPPVL